MMCIKFSSISLSLSSSLTQPLRLYCLSDRIMQGALLFSGCFWLLSQLKWGEGLGEKPKCRFP